MNVLLIFIRSLCLAIVLSFVAPWIIIGGVMIGLDLGTQIPGLTTLSQAGESFIWHILAIFGNGEPLEGLLVLGVTSSLVGAMFDAFAFYREQIWHTH
ncbi:hypothetical protein [Roseofilum capinflatum]|uniref:Uncharacterized protein n=1 Tax=Roseofilum capinflatum BLCC-M114 TaxID=3022440 RepID=A0ABT7B8E0_9CYAN|nr:hypothetical protein [Roseofilum capinflatum]MDJ1174859.1 hypothetical protein [Roseofilum capinflatum BLCC-M114]